MNLNEDDDNTDTYVSMEDFRLELSELGDPRRRPTDNTGISGHSDFPLDADNIDDDELMNNLGDVAEETFPPGSYNLDGHQGINTSDSNTVPQVSSTGRTGQSEFLDSHSFGFEFRHREDTEHMDMADETIQETPRVVRDQVHAMEYLLQHTGQAYDGDEVTQPSIAEAVTETTVQNYFKQAHEYTQLANPNENNMELQLFSRIGKAGEPEEKALEALAYGEKNPLSRIVEMMAYTVEFQTYELSKVKSSGIDIFQASNLEDHNNWSEVDSRRSMCIRTLLEELDNKDNQYKSLESQLTESKSLLEKERKINSDFRTRAEKIDPRVRFNRGAEDAFNTLTDIYKSYQRNSDAKVRKQRMEIEEYAERLLEYEKRLQEVERQKSKVISENTALKVELASHAQSDQCHHSLQETKIDCKFKCDDHDHSSHLDMESWVKEKSTLIEETSVLRSKIRESQYKKEMVEDELFKVNIDLEEARRKIKSLRSSLDESQAHEKMLKESHEHLQKHSREVAKELSQNTIDAALEIDRKESRISHLRFELEDRESALKSYKDRIKQLEEQINKLSDESIRRAQTMGTADSPNYNDNEYSSSPTDAPQNTMRIIKESSFTKNMHREYDDAKELIAEKNDEIDNLKKSIHDMERNIRLVEDECEMWKSNAQNAARECEALKKDDFFETGATQIESSMRRLSIKLNVQGNSRRDILRHLIERIEELIQERAALEETKEKLNGRIVERERMIHSMRSEYGSEISALNVQITQLQHSNERLESDRKEVEAQLDKIANMEVDTMDTHDGSLFDASPANSRRVQYTTDDEGHSITAAKKAVEELVGSKIDLASDYRHLSEKLNGLISGGVKEGGSTKVPTQLVKEARDTNDELLRVIGEQSRTIKKLHRSRHTNENNTMNNSVGQDDDSTWPDDTFTINSEVTQRASSGASAFVRKQLNEERVKLTEKINDNTKLSSSIKEMEHKMVHLVNENDMTQSQFKDLTNLHQKFVKNLADMLEVNATTVVIESTVRNFLNMTDMLRDQITDARTFISQQSTRMCKFGAQKRVLQHIIGIYQRKYHLNILALPTTRSAAGGNGKKNTGVSVTKRKLRACVYAVRAKNRILHLFKERKATAKQQEYVDVTKMFHLPGAHRIADGRLSTIPIDNALFALQSVEKLRKALAAKNQEITDLRASLTTLDHSLPLPNSSVAMPESSNMNFDYDEELMKRKNALTARLTKALADKEQVEALLSHERIHRANSEARANKYLEKASRLHKKLQTVRFDYENRERTYKNAIRYFKQRAESAINVDFDYENAEPNGQQLQQQRSTSAEMYSSSQSTMTRTEYMSDLVKYLTAKLKKENEALEALEKGTVEHDEQKTKVNGIRATLKNLRMTGAKATSSLATSAKSQTRTRSRKASASTATEGGEKLDKNTTMANI